jgi:hypothetical protein
MSHYKDIPYGFEFGAAKVTRCMSDDKKGWVVVAIDTPKGHTQIYVTKTGKLRVFTDKKELK